jgi:SsrA-binding protein
MHGIGSLGLDRVGTRAARFEKGFDSCSLFLYHYNEKNRPMADNEQRNSRQRPRDRTGRAGSGGVVISNRKARHDYHILETIEAGIALRGTEVKSLRQGNANLQDSYANVKNGEVWLYNMHISPYERGSVDNHEPKRTRKLLLHKRQIRKLQHTIRERGLTLIPVSVYFEGAYAKVELAVARGKKSFDKREALAQREAQREIAKRLKRSLS